MQPQLDPRWFLKSTLKGSSLTPMEMSTPQGRFWIPIRSSISRGSMFIPRLESTSKVGFWNANWNLTPGNLRNLSWISIPGGPCKMAIWRPTLKPCAVILESKLRFWKWKIADWSARNCDADWQIWLVLLETTGDCFQRKKTVCTPRWWISSHFSPYLPFLFSAYASNKLPFWSLFPSSQLFTIDSFPSLPPLSFPLFPRVWWCLRSFCIPRLSAFSVLSWAFVLSSNCYWFPPSALSPSSFSLPAVWKSNIKANPSVARCSSFFSS